MKDVKMDEILKLDVSNLIFLVGVNLLYIGSIPNVMIDKVPSNNVVISIYKQIPKISHWHIPDVFQAILGDHVVTRCIGAGGKGESESD